MQIEEILGYQYFPKGEEDAADLLVQEIDRCGRFFAIYSAISYGIILGKRMERTKKQAVNA